MDYRACAEELMNCMIASEERGNLVQKNLAELAHGELAVLCYLTNGCDGVSAKALSKRFGVNTSRVAAILNSLEKKAFIRREGSQGDKRMIHVYITERGEAYVQARKEEFLVHSASILEALGPEDAQNYVRIMKRLSVLLESDRL